MQKLRCSNTDAHNSHSYEKELVHKCTGETDCGTVTHNPHEFKRVETVWCDGICNCGQGIVHGPGRHK